MSDTRTDELSTPEDADRAGGGLSPPGWFRKTLLYSVLVPLGLMILSIVGCFTLIWLNSLLPLSYRTPAGWVMALMLMPGVAAAAFVAGRRCARGKTLPESFFDRFFPVLAPFLLLAAAPAPVMLLFENGLSPSAALLILLALSAPLGIVCLAQLLGFLTASRRQARTRHKTRGALALLLILASFCCAGAWAGFDLNSRWLHSSEEASVGHGIDPYAYMPFTGHDNLLARPGASLSLTITANYPRLDGAIALLPLYGAAAQAVYGLPGGEEGAPQKRDGTQTPETQTANPAQDAEGADADGERKEDASFDFEEQEPDPREAFVNCSNTPGAYKALADGEADIFFGLGPSEEQRAYAEAKGLTLRFTPLAREAFVFFVHKDNPVSGLTRGQIRAIYTRKLTNWKELGGPDEPILAFQRPEGSGSQTTLIAEVMSGEKPMRPLREEYAGGMGDIINRVAEYRNRLNAVGYSFRWYATVQYAQKDIRLLAIDGVAPTRENIRNGSYPLTTTFFAVTARPLSEESAALLEWLTCPEGRELIERVGYVSLDPDPGERPPAKIDATR